MSYTKLTNQTVNAGETAVQLDSGQIIAVSCARSLDGGNIVFATKARQIDTTIARQFRVSIPVTLVDANGADTIAGHCLLAALGETYTPIDGVTDFGNNLPAYSIRVAIAAQAAVGTVDAGAVL